MLDRRSPPRLRHRIRKPATDARVIQVIAAVGVPPTNRSRVMKNTSLPLGLASRKIGVERIGPTRQQMHLPVGTSY